MRRMIACVVTTVVFWSCGGGAQFGTVEFGDLIVSGEVDGDYLNRQLLQLDPPFQACYVRALRNDRDTRGVIAVRLKGGNHRLIPELTSDSTGSTELSECVLNAISGLNILEPETAPPWDFTAEWSVTFAVVEPDAT